MSAAKAESPTMRCISDAQTKNKRSAAVNNIQKSYQKSIDVHLDIADASGLQPADVKRCLEALRKVAVESLIECSIFKIQGFVKFRLKKTSARPEGVKNMFGKTARLRAKPAGERIIATVVKPFDDIFMR